MHEDDIDKALNEELKGKFAKEFVSLYQKYFNELYKRYGYAACLEIMDKFIKNAVYEREMIDYGVREFLKGGAK